MTAYLEGVKMFLKKFDVPCKYMVYFVFNRTKLANNDIFIDRTILVRYIIIDNDYY